MYGQLDMQPDKNSEWTKEERNSEVEDIFLLTVALNLVYSFISFLVHAYLKSGSR